MLRREFIGGGLAGGAASPAIWPRTARAQQPGKLPTIGFLGGTTAAAASPTTAAFLQRLHELGWAEGRNLAIEYRWAEGRREAAVEFLAAFARLTVALIHTTANTPTLNAK